jgi:hypothetical protein
VSTLENNTTLTPPYLSGANFFELFSKDLFVPAQVLPSFLQEPL